MSRRAAVDSRSDQHSGQRVEVLQSLLDQVTDGVVAVDREGKPLAFNSAAVRILRMDLAQTTVAQWIERSHCYLSDGTTLCSPDQLHVARAMRGETAPATDLFVRYPDAPEGFWVSVGAHPLRGPDGVPAGAVVVLRDITETQQARIALRRSEAMCRSLVENVQDVIVVLDAEGAIQFLSPAIQTTLGYAPAELIGRSAFDLLHPEDRPGVLDSFRTGIESPDGVASEDFQLRHKDGSWRHFAGIGKNLLGTPEIAGVVITMRDVTERVIAGKQALFRTSLLEHIRTAIVALDTEGRIVYWSKFAQTLGQWTPEEVLGRRIVELGVARSDRDRCDELLQEVQSTGRCKGEISLPRRDGTTVPGLLTAAEVRDRQGKLIGYVGAVVDITEQKESEKKLNAVCQQLRELAARTQTVREAERKRIASNIHDDLGQQLTVLKLELFHIQKKLSRKSVGPEEIPSLQSAIDLVNSTMESLRRIGAELRPSALDHLGLADAIEWQLQQFQSHTRIRCSITRTEEQLPLEPERAIEVFRVFEEILANVARHAHANAVEVDIKRDRGNLIVEVHDNGKGITKKQIADPGSLGLLGMRERARRLAGELSVQGVRGKGTRVSLRVPIARQKGKCAQDSTCG
jgi:PAS domain S-box-containing protein